MSIYFKNVLITSKQENICSYIISGYSNKCRAHLCNYIETKLQATVCCHGYSSVIHQQTEFSHPGCHSVVFQCKSYSDNFEGVKIVSPAINQDYSSLRCELTRFQLCACTQRNACGMGQGRRWIRIL